MTITFYNMPQKIQAGITIKNNALDEQFNIALHACHSTAAVLNNRMKLAQRLQLPESAFTYANQTHSANFIQLTPSEKGLGAMNHANALQNIDAMYTYENDIVCTSMSADCVPILFYSEAHHLVGAIHSGWSGTVKEITRQVFTHLNEHEQIDLTTVHVHIGRALSKEKFEVDNDVYDKFAQLPYAKPMISFQQSNAKYTIDNQLVVAEQCLLAGILNENITIDRTCTFTDPQSFSYREQRDCGRHVSFIVQKGE